MKEYVMTTTEKLYSALQDLPEPAIEEILDFAEFLRGKMMHRQTHSNTELLNDLIGGLENSTTFAGDPLEIQKRLRNEWE